MCLGVVYCDSLASWYKVITNAQDAVPNFIVFLEHLICFLEVETLKAADFDYIVFQAPLFGF